jgi:hypothetical protein
MENSATVTDPLAGALPEGAAPALEEKKEGDPAVEAEDEAVKPMYERYEYLDPRKWTPICTLKISLISPQWGYLSKYQV